MKNLFTKGYWLMFWLAVGLFAFCSYSLSQGIYGEYGEIIFGMLALAGFFVTCYPPAVGRFFTIFFMLTFSYYRHYFINGSLVEAFNLCLMHLKEIFVHITCIFIYVFGMILSPVIPPFIALFRLIWEWKYFRDEDLTKYTKTGKRIPEQNNSNK